MPSKIRLQRIADRIRQELSEMLVKEVADPRLSGISVTDVKVDRELAWADVFVSAVEGQQRSKEVLEGLRSAVGFLRRALTERVDLRVFPRLRFHWDPTPERADHIERIMAALREEEALRAAAAPVDLNADDDSEDDIEDDMEDGVEDDGEDYIDDDVEDGEEDENADER
jgi:ribosome-binding factor A